MTFAQFPDGAAMADPDCHSPIDAYVVNRKTSQTAELVTFELSTPLDQTSKMLPGRMVLKRHCSWRYRSYDGATFDYTKVECPYTGTDYFTPEGDATDKPALDNCGKRVSDCKLRFVGEPLPFGGFPGVRRFN